MPRGNPTLAGAARQWPTPDAGVFGLTADVDKHMARVARLKAKKINGNGAGIPLAVEVRRWPTPRATDGEHGGRVTPRKARNGGNLIEAVSADRWPTPTASDAKASGSAGYPVTATHHAGTTLTDAVVRWPTPTARDWKDGSFTPNVEVNGLLGRAVWQTPSAADGMGGHRTRGGTRSNELLLAGQAQRADGVSSGSLNPDWVELLMGFPTGWTIAGPLPQDPSSTGSLPEPSPAESRSGSSDSKPAATPSSRKSSTSSGRG